jgi:hypothetical protein
MNLRSAGDKSQGSRVTTGNSLYRMFTQPKRAVEHSTEVLQTCILPASAWLIIHVNTHLANSGSPTISGTNHPPARCSGTIREIIFQFPDSVEGPPSRFGNPPNLKSIVGPASEYCSRTILGTKVGGDSTDWLDV